MVCCAAFSMILACLIGLKTMVFPSQPKTPGPLAWRLAVVENEAAPAGQVGPGFRIAARLRSFRFAGAGLVYLLKHEHNARIHASAALTVGLLALWLKVSVDDWRWLIVAISMVIAGEALNTAVERICDLVSPGHNDLVRISKDVAAAAVLVLAIAAVLIGVLTFEPYIGTLLQNTVPWNLTLCRSPTIL